MVSLIRNIQTREEFALKTIDTRKLSEKDKSAAECEAEFLKVISGPTIIKFYKSFVENHNIFIIMEYAETGTLAQEIEKHAYNGQKFTDD